ncbi:MAG: ComF family protein, partial [Planctomycetota bacterium]
RRRRGLDQAAVLAELVAARLRLVHVTGVMTRVRDTLAQGDVRVTSRERNVAGAFRVRRPLPVRDRVVVLVDDVTTSASTARECARVLRAVGVLEVVLLTAAVAR